MTVHPFFTPPKRHIDRVFIHCSASDRPEHDDIRVIYQWHRARGFTDVGYHYFITADGTIQPGRPLQKIPAAQQGNNTGTIAICLHGLTRFTPEQFDSLRELCTSIRLAIPDVTFHGHCEVDKGKDCPVFDFRAVLRLDALGQMKTPI